MSHFSLPDKTRKKTLCREMLSLIQDDLRNHIQNQLLADTGLSSLGQSGSDNVVGGSGSKDAKSGNGN